MYQVYDKSSITRDIQKYLSETAENGERVAPTGIYDDKTRLAVSNFQKKNNLKSTGSVDEITMNLLYESFLRKKHNRQTVEETYTLINFPITQGQRSDGLMKIHRAMATLLDYYGHTHRILESNFYSDETKNAINILRQIYLLDEDDIIDECLYFRIMNDLRSIKKLKYDD